VDIGGHPPFPAGSKQLSSNFDNLLFLAVFRVLNFWSRFEALNDVFGNFATATYPKKRHLGPQNSSRSSGPEKLLKIVNYQNC
jgi:hypothetical protein